jgi:hypothetical protein
MSDCTERCSAMLLTDEPAAEDAYGPHSRVARAIVDMVMREGDGRFC